jgi:hypothetical protein
MHSALGAAVGGVREDDEEAAEEEGEDGLCFESGEAEEVEAEGGCARSAGAREVVANRNTSHVTRSSCVTPNEPYTHTRATAQRQIHRETRSTYISAPYHLDGGVQPRISLRLCACSSGFGLVVGVRRKQRYTTNTTISGRAVNCEADSHQPLMRGASCAANC